MFPIAHVLHHPCPPSRSMHYYGNVPHHPYSHHPCASSPYPLCSCAPFAHVPYCPCIPLPYPHVDLEGGHATLPICPITPVPMSRHIGDGAAKCQMMSSCQKDVYCQKIKYLDYGNFTKNKLT